MVCGTGLLNRLSLGGNEGEENHQLTVDELASHSHGLTNQQPGASGGGHAQFQIAYEEPTYFEYGWIGNTGGDQPHNNMPPYLTVNYLIKY